MLTTGVSAAREREMGTFGQLPVTPMRPTEILLGKALPEFLVGTAEGSLIILVAIFWFHVPWGASNGIEAIPGPAYGAESEFEFASEMQNIVHRLAKCAARVKAMPKAIVQVQEILKNAQTNSEVGQTMTKFVLEAEARVLSSHSMLFQAQRSESIAQLALKLSTGTFQPDSLP